MSAAASVYDFTVRDIMRREVPMRDLLGGKVALIVNGE
jgi:glutathione peroxidase-family protein